VHILDGQARARLVSDMGELGRPSLDGRILRRRHVCELQAVWDEHLEDDRLVVLEVLQVVFLVLGPLVEPGPQVHVAQVVETLSLHPLAPHDARVEGLAHELLLCLLRVMAYRVSWVNYLAFWFRFFLVSTHGSSNWLLGRYKVCSRGCCLVTFLKWIPIFDLACAWLSEDRGTNTM
jgi:hypothetical protein